MKVRTLSVIFGCVMLALFVLGMRKVFAGEVLTAAEPPRDWSGMVVALLVGAAVVGLVWYLIQPGTLDNVKALIASVRHKVSDTEAPATVIPKQWAPPKEPPPPETMDPIFRAAMEARDAAAGKPKA